MAKAAANKRKRGSDDESGLIALDAEPYKMILTDIEREQRSKLRGAVKNHFDRTKYIHDVRLQCDQDGLPILYNVTSKKLVSRLSDVEAQVFVENPHIQQVSNHYSLYDECQC